MKIKLTELRSTIDVIVGFESNGVPQWKTLEIVTQLPKGMEEIPEGQSRKFHREYCKELIEILHTYQRACVSASYLELDNGVVGLTSDWFIVQLRFCFALGIIQHCRI